MRLIVGLSNPGKEYQNTRHTVGFIILDNYLKDAKWSKKDLYYEYITTIASEKVCFIKPLTYMNLSGNAVGKVSNYYHIDSKDILIIHDDLDLPMMKYRIKYNSSSGGHNGIKSIIASLNTTEFSHLKIGIGKNDNIETKDYVLSKLSSKEIEFLSSPIFGEIIESFITKSINECMNLYNGE